MKKLHSLLTTLVLLFNITSCDETFLKVTPEISVPEGYTNYFIEDLLLESDSNEVRIAFQINTDWIMEVVGIDGESIQWCSVNPTSGNAGLHKAMVRVDNNPNDSARTAKIQLKASSVKIAEIFVIQRGSKEDISITPPDVIVQESFWKSEEDVESMVAASYRLMAQWDFLSRILAWGELRGDNVVEGNYNHDNEVKYIMEANILPNNSYAQWSVFYRIINNCNLVLKYAPEVLDEVPNFTQEDLDVVRGEMLALRALCHFYLIRTFRDIPLQTEAVVDNSQYLYPSQATSIEALDHCLSDLHEAEELVPASGYHSTASENKGRVTKESVHAMIADVLLWKAAFTLYDGNKALCEQYYRECITYCDLVINNYSLLEGDEAYNAVFGQQNSSESILEIQCESNTTIPYFYGKGDKKGVLAPSNYLLQPSDEMADNLYKPTDIRRVSFMNADGSNNNASLITKYTAETHTGEFTSSTPYITPVYRIADWSNGMFCIESNWIIYRITDVMLMKAEALAYLPNATEQELAAAFGLVSTVYNRSNNIEGIEQSEGLTYQDGASAIRALVLAERQRELCFEGKRWYDLVRKSLCDSNTTDMLDIMLPHKYGSNIGAYRAKMSNIDILFFPIHEREIKTNHNLTQNPAYRTEDVYEDVYK